MIGEELEGMTSHNLGSFIAFEATSTQLQAFRKT